MRLRCWRQDRLGCWQGWDGGKYFAHHHAEIQRIAEFPACRQPSVGGDPGTMEVKLHDTVNIEPEWPIGCFTPSVRQGNLARSGLNHRWSFLHLGVIARGHPLMRQVRFHPGQHRANRASEGEGPPFRIGARHLCSMRRDQVRRGLSLAASLALADQRVTLLARQGAGAALREAAITVSGLPGEGNKAGFGIGTRAT